MSLSRRRFLAGTAAVAATAIAAPYAHAQKRGGTLKFVPHADLKILDPIWTTAYITRNHGYMIFDTLFALDGNLKLQPQMVDKYTVSKDAMKYSFTLRDGLKFHDGAPVTAEDCVASIKRWAARDSVGRLLLAALAKMVPTDKRTFTIELETPFGLVLDALGKPSASPSFIMPARLAATDPNEQIKDVIGSGPFKFSKDEWQPGNRVVYLRNPDYVPRKENPSGAAGAKRVLVDRVEWRYIPDAAVRATLRKPVEKDLYASTLGENPSTWRQSFFDLVAAASSSVRKLASSDSANATTAATPSTSRPWTSGGTRSRGTRACSRASDPGSTSRRPASCFRTAARSSRSRTATRTRWRPGSGRSTPSFRDS